MGAPEAIQFSTDLASRAAMRRDTEAEQHEARIRELASQKFNAMRAAIVMGDEAALRHAEAAMLEYLDGSGELRNLLRAAFSQGFDIGGRELQRVCKDFLHADSEHDAERELSPARKKPLGDSIRLGMDAAMRAVAQLAK